jgi:hypothetical protein
MMQGWIISWNNEHGGGWINKLAYADAVQTVQSLIEQGIDPAQIVVNKCGIDYYSAAGFMRQYGGSIPASAPATGEDAEQATTADLDTLDTAVATDQNCSIEPAVEVLVKRAKQLALTWAQLGDDKKDLKELIEKTYASIRRVVALLSGEAPIYVHHYEFGADQVVSLHLTEKQAIQDVQNIWTQNEFDPETDGSIILAAALNGKTATTCWVLGENGALIDPQGKKMTAF